MPNGSSSSQVQFNEPGMSYNNRPPRGPRQSWLVKLVMQLGLAKNAKQAAVVLVVIGVVAVGLAIAFWPGGDDYVIVPQPGLEDAQQ